MTNLKCFIKPETKELRQEVKPSLRDSLALWLLLVFEEDRKSFGCCRCSQTAQPLPHAESTTQSRSLYRLTSLQSLCMMELSGIVQAVVFKSKSCTPTQRNRTHYIIFHLSRAAHWLYAQTALLAKTNSEARRDLFGRNSMASASYILQKSRSFHRHHLPSTPEPRI